MEWKENMSKEEFEKAIQSAEDRVRTQLYNEKIKPLESEIAELKPKQKSEKELELEKKEKELLAKERQYKVRDTLEKNNLPSQLAKFINASDDEIDSVITELSEVLDKHILNTSYKPSNKNNKGDAVTKEQFKNMNYFERQKLYESNQELYKKLSQ